MKNFFLLAISLTVTGALCADFDSSGETNFELKKWDLTQVETHKVLKRALSEEFEQKTIKKKTGRCLILFFNEWSVIERTYYLSSKQKVIGEKCSNMREAFFKRYLGSPFCGKGLPWGNVYYGYSPMFQSQKAVYKDGHVMDCLGYGEAWEVKLLRKGVGKKLGHCSFHWKGLMDFKQNQGYYQTFQKNRAVPLSKEKCKELGEAFFVNGRPCSKKGRVFKKGVVEQQVKWHSTKGSQILHSNKCPEINKPDLEQNKTVQLKIALEKFGKSLLEMGFDLEKGGTFRKGKDRYVISKQTINIFLRKKIFQGFEATAVSKDGSFPEMKVLKHLIAIAKKHVDIDAQAVLEGVENDRFVYTKALGSYNFYIIKKKVDRYHFAYGLRVNIQGNQYGHFDYLSFL
ncbi:MAG: hypothetical protein WD025_01220 [Bacteriovoracaceae bacterium]